MSSPRLLVQLVEPELEELIQRAVTRALNALPSNSNDRRPKLLSVDEAAEMLRCSRRKVGRLISSGRLSVAKLGDGGSTRARIPLDSVEALIKESTSARGL